MAKSPHLHEVDVTPVAKSSTRVVDGRRVLVHNNYTPALLAILANRMSRGASKFYRRHFGVGLTEWRTLGMLALEPDIPAMRVAEVTGMDKAAVSRALSKLRDRGLVLFEATSSDPRRKTWRLSGPGVTLYERILNLALLRQKTLLTGLTADEVNTFNHLARRLIDNLPDLENIVLDDEA